MAVFLGFQGLWKAVLVLELLFRPHSSASAKINGRYYVISCFIQLVNFSFSEWTGPLGKYFARITGRTSSDFAALLHAGFNFFLTSPQTSSLTVY